MSKEVLKLKSHWLRFLTAHGRFLLLLKLKKDRLQFMSRKTPGTGFCFYLIMHYQAYQFSSNFLKDGTTTFPEVKAYVALGEEFKTLVKEDIDYFQKEIRKPISTNQIVKLLNTK